MAAQSPAVAAGMKGGVGRSSRGREQRSLFSTCTDFHQLKLAVSLHSVADGVNESSGHGASHHLSTREGIYTISLHKIPNFRAAGLG